MDSNPIVAINYSEGDYGSASANGGKMRETRIEIHQSDRTMRNRAKEKDGSRWEN